MLNRNQGNIESWSRELQNNGRNGIKKLKDESINRLIKQYGGVNTAEGEYLEENEKVLSAKQLIEFDISNQKLQLIKRPVKPFEIIWGKIE